MWVDDLLLFATSESILTKMGNDLHAEWEITDLGEPAKIVGIEITRTKDSIILSQKRYIKVILQREGLTKANAVGMPLDPNVALEPNPDGNVGDRSNSYARLLGELQFLANATRPEIAYAVNRLASYTANPSMQHTTALKRILRYLSGTRSYGITYNLNPQYLALLGYADAAYANADDLKSTSGYVTAKTAIPTKVDSKLSDAHLESLKRREGERGNATKARGRVKCGGIAQKILLSEYRSN